MDKFRIYYDDDSTFSGDPYLAPANGVIIIANEEQGNKRGYSLIKSGDAYYYRDWRWWACDHFGLYDHLMFHVGPKAILFGRTIRNDSYWKIVNNAIDRGI